MTVLKYVEGTKIQLDRCCKNNEVLRRVMEETRTIKRRKDNWFFHILRRNCLLKRIIKEKTEKGRKDEEEAVSRYWVILRKQAVWEFERVSTRSHGLENSFWKRLWTCRKTDCLAVKVVVIFLINIQTYKFSKNIFRIASPKNVSWFITVTSVWCLFFDQLQTAWQTHILEVPRRRP